MSVVQEITSKAMSLSAQERLTLASALLESTERGADPEAEVAWDSEIRDRIQAIDEGRVQGVPYNEVMREAGRQLAP